jgi:NADH:ubiquinone oxidoreductase subunit E
MTDTVVNNSQTNPLEIPDQRAIIDEILDTNRNALGATMVVLNEIQSRIGFISAPVQAYVAQRLRVPMSQINGVVSFYSFFSTRPQGKHTLKFCMGTACYVAGTPQLIEKAKQSLGVDVGETTKDGQISLEVCRCVGACSQAPVLIVDEDMKGRVRPNKLPPIIRKIQNHSESTH